MTNKISVQEELTNKDEEDVEKIILCKPPLVKTSSNTSSNFEANRASVANALLGFTRKPSTKKQAAPKPPVKTLEPSETPATSETPEVNNQVLPVAGVIPEPPPPPPEPLTPTIQVTTNPTTPASVTPSTPATPSTPVTTGSTDLVTKKAVAKLQLVTKLYVIKLRFHPIGENYYSHISLH